MEQGLTLAQKAERAKRVGERYGVNLEAAPEDAADNTYRFGLCDGLSRAAGDEYEQIIAHQLIAAGRQDLVSLNDDAKTYRVLPLMRFIYDSQAIEALEQKLPSREAEEAIKRAMLLSKLMAVKAGCNKMALGCNTHQPPFLGAALETAALKRHDMVLHDPATEMDIVDISAPVFEKFRELGIGDGDAIVFLGTTLTMEHDNYWPLSLKEEGISTVPVSRKAQADLTRIIYTDASWEQMKKAGDADTVGGFMTAVHECFDMQKWWGKLTQRLVSQQVNGKSPKALIAGCTDIGSFPLSSDLGMVPGTNVPEFSTLDLHAMAIAKQIATEAPVLSPEQQQRIKQQPYQFDVQSDGDWPAELVVGAGACKTAAAKPVDFRP